MNDERTLPALVPDTHPEHLLPAFPVNLVLAAMSGHSSDELAEAMAEANILLAEALASGQRKPSERTRRTLFIFKSLFRAFCISTTDRELFNRRIAMQYKTETGLFSPDSDEIPD